jgi:hypothetical protein
VNIAVQLETSDAAPSPVDYTWDPDTEILSAHLREKTSGTGMSGSVGLEGSDGSWLILDVKSGRINAVEVAVWPEVRRLPTLAPPASVDDAGVLVPGRRSQPALASVEVNTRLRADSDAAERTFHFLFGTPRDARTVRLARDILLDVDDEDRIAGVWLLNVPPCPAG